VCPLTGSRAPAPRSRNSCWWSRCEPGQTQRVAGLALLLVDEVDGSQHRERVGSFLFGPVAVQVRPPGPVGVWRVVQGDLDVIEAVVQSVRCDELGGDIEGARSAERGIGGRKALRWQKPEMLAYCVRRGRIGRDQGVDLAVDGDQKVLRDDPGHDQVAIVAKSP